MPTTVNTRPMLPLLLLLTLSDTEVPSSIMANFAHLPRRSYLIGEERSHEDTQFAELTTLARLWGLIKINLLQPAFLSVYPKRVSSGVRLQSRKM